MEYELVCGLETHIELATKTKIFCGCAVGFGGEPNTRCCPVCLGLPGSLPRLNREVVNYAIRLGLALNAEILPISHMARKNYTYPDLPKAYQLTQYEAPICRNGRLILTNGRAICIERIQMEEDAGKLIRRDGKIWIDYNRAGIPLLEIVSSPSLHSAEEARDYIERMQQLVRTLGISDGKMQEGSMRCDVNISIRPKGSQILGTRTEIKNMNSTSFIVQAINYEFHRQIKVMESGGDVIQETRRYIEQNGTTESMRGKETTDDYRFFPDPDLPAVVIQPEMITAIRENMPELPDDRCRRFTAQFGLSADEARLLVKHRRIADYFEAAAFQLKNPHLIARWLLGPIFSRIDNESAREACEIPISPSQLRELALLVEEKNLNGNVARITLEKMLDTGKSCTAFLTEHDFTQITPAELEKICYAALKQNEQAVIDYRKGKEKALKALLGAVMRTTKGRADPSVAQNQLLKLLNEKQ